jgi:diaminopimelate epimerase
MDVQFIKTNPTQNMTILVESHHNREMYHRVASRIMAYDNVFAEQVGFIESSESGLAWARLQMMAGEFCGNATMSLAAVMAWKMNLQQGKIMEVPLEVSGTNQLLLCRVKAQKNGYLCKLDMPLPLSIDKKTIKCSGKAIQTTILRYSGIVHAIVDVPSIDTYAKEMAQIMVKSPELLQDEAAIGIMLYRKHGNEMAPLVYVPCAGTMIWERGCGSGAAALGTYVALETQRDVHMEIKQPGGIIEVWVRCQKGIIDQLEIQGHVDISAVGTAFV